MVYMSYTPKFLTSMTTLTDTQIKLRRDAILLEMQSIREMIRGKLSLQILKRTKADGSVQERGPYAVFQRWLNGKNHSERIPADKLPAISRAVEGYERFNLLADEYAALSEILTQRGGVMLPSKKKLIEAASEEKYQETEAFLKKALQQINGGSASRQGDTQWLEVGLRTALLADGAKILGELLGSIKAPEDNLKPGEKCHPKRKLVIQTLFGEISISRNYYYDASKRGGLRGRCPLDKHLGLFGHCTAGFAKIATRAAAESSYEEACSDLKHLAGLKYGARQLQRLSQHVGATLKAKLKLLPPPKLPASIPVMYVEADGTGVPMNSRGLQGVKGRSPDGQAKTREVKAGCVFTQTGLDTKGRPVRDEKSTTWIAGFETASDFGPRLRDEAQRRGIAKAKKVVFLGDGASWLWELARNYFPEAICILDFWHASEYLFEMAKLINSEENSAAKQYESWRGMMAQSQTAAILAQAREHLAVLPAKSKAAETMEQNINYLQNQSGRMDYARYRAEGLFIGSGVVEAGCKKVIGARFKCGGMFWSEPGARNLLQIRTALLSQDRFEDFWKAQAAA